eukprot:103241-Pelagomonas_calceolata.AAC.3
MPRRLCTSDTLGTTNGQLLRWVKHPSSGTYCRRRGHGRGKGCIACISNQDMNKDWKWSIACISNWVMIKDSLHMPSLAPLPLTKGHDGAQHPIICRKL